MKTCFAFLLIIITMQCSCQTKKSNDGNYVSVGLPKDDPTFLALMDTAQSHLQTFIDSIKIHGADTANYTFAVKSDFFEKDEHEHMWSRIFSYNDGSFKGYFADSAFVLKHIKTYDQVTLKRKVIEDWSIYNLNTGKTIGNYSDMYLKKKEKEE